MDDAAGDGRPRRRWRRGIVGGRASRLELYAVAAVVLVLGFGSVGGAIVIATNDQGSQAAAPITTVVESVPTTVEVPATVPPTVAVAPTTTEAPPPVYQPSTPSTYVETYAPPITLPPLPGPSGRPCTVPDLVASGAGPWMDVAARGISLVSASGCKLPTTSSSCVDASLQPGWVRTLWQNPAAGTVIDSNAIWYMGAAYSPDVPTARNANPPWPKC